MNIDLHVHCSERSTCAHSSEEEQVRAAIAAGLDAIVFTDHHHMVPFGRLEALNRQFAPFRVFSGVEVTADGEDCLVYGVRHPSLECTGWTYQSLYTFVRQQEGMIVLAHAFRYSPEVKVDVHRYCPDAIEGRSANIVPEAELEIRKMAARLGLPLLCNSDAHTTASLGCYYNVLENHAENEIAIFTAIKAGRFRTFVGGNGC